MSVAETILDFVRLWGYAGLAVAVAFLGYGIDRIDEDARGAYLFRILAIPGAILLWPLVIRRWWVLETGRDRWPPRHRPPRRSHGVAALGMLALIPIIFAGALALRQTLPEDHAPVRLPIGEQTR